MMNSVRTLGINGKDIGYECAVVQHDDECSFEYGDFLTFGKEAC